MQHWSKSFDSRWSMEMWKVHQASAESSNRICTNCQLPGRTNSTPSQPLRIAFQNKLKIHQWNAGGIHPKFVEFRDWLFNSDVDVLAVQESKLRKTDKTPFIKGYITVQKDRNNILGGGLLLFIWTDIVFEKLHSFKKAGMEILSIRLKTTKSTWLELYNVYLPNTSTRHNLFDPSVIEPGLSSLILSDLNGHS